MKLSSWLEIGSDDDVLLTPYVPKGITGYDDDGKHRVFPHIYWIFHETLDHFYVYYGFKMAGSYIAKTTQHHGQANPRVESPRQMGQVETEEHMAKNSTRRGQRS